MLPFKCNVGTCLAAVRATLSRLLPWKCCQGESLSLIMVHIFPIRAALDNLTFSHGLKMLTLTHIRVRACGWELKEMVENDVSILTAVKCRPCYV